MDKIILLLLSETDAHLIEVLSGNLEKTFNRKVEVRQRLINLKFAYNRGRYQYLSPKILSRLRRIRKDPGDKIMGIVAVDLYSEGYDFVYGEADVNAGVATLSFARLCLIDADNQQAAKIFEERVLREAIHEMGHLFGLLHCSDPKCVMRTCTCEEEVDEAGNALCNECNDLLAPHIR